MTNIGVKGEGNLVGTVYVKDTKKSCNKTLKESVLDVFKNWKTSIKVEGPCCFICVGIQHFHETSLRPCWCLSSKQRRSCCFNNYEKNNIISFL